MRQSQFPKSNSPKPEVAAPALQKVWPKPMDFWWFFSKCQLHQRGGAGHPPVHPSNTGSTPGRNGWKMWFFQVWNPGIHEICSAKKLLGFWGTFFHRFTFGKTRWVFPDPGFSWHLGYVFFLAIWWYVQYSGGRKWLCPISASPKLQW